MAALLEQLAADEKHQLINCSLPDFETKAYCATNKQMYKNFTSLGLCYQQLPKLLRIMRLTAIILMISFVHLSAATLAQKISISEKNASLEKVLKEIRKQSGYDIIYDLNLVTNTKPVSVNVNKANLFEVLQKTLTPQQLTFTVDGKTIVIKERGVMDKITDMVADDDVTVKILDSLNRPIAGANVYNKTINKMYMTNKDGEVLIPNVPANGYVLQISYIGFNPEEIYVTRKTKTYAVLMRQASEKLEEVNVYYDGFQKIKSNKAAGAYSVLSKKELEETPAVNILERIEGKVPGAKVNIKNNTIQIRGVNDYAGSGGTPLIVVDGFPLLDRSDFSRLSTAVGANTFGNSVISNINIADIEQITFLKDAAAGSIWGNKAANGVIVIETKKGKKSAATLNANYIFGISKNPSISSLKWMNSSQYVDLEQEMVDKGFLVDPALSTGSNAIYAPNNSEATEWMYRVKRGTATTAERDAALAEIKSRNGAKQIEDYLLQNAVNHQYNLSYSGGSENNTYSISGNYTKDIPIFKSNFGENAFINVNTATDFFNKKVNLRMLFNYQHSKTQYNAAGVNAVSVSTTALRPYDLLFDNNGNSIGRTIIFRESLANTMIGQGYLPFSYNTIDQLNYSNSVDKNNVFRMNAGLNGKITSWLNADVSISNQRQMGNSYTLDELDSYDGRIFVNTGTVITNGKPVYNVPYGGRYITSGTRSSLTNYRGQLNLDKKINSSGINAIFGLEFSEKQTEGTSETRYGFNPDTRSVGLANPNVAYMTMYGYTQTLGQNLSGLGLGRNREMSYYANINYGFKEKYYISGSYRVDDGTRVGLERANRSKPFWNLGVRWNAGKEDFLQKEWLNNLSVRASVGINGVMPPVTGANVTLLGAPYTDSRTGQPVITIDAPENSQLGWSTTKMNNIGVEFGLFKGRLSGTFDFYTKRTTDIFAQFPFNPTYGWSTLTFNSGKLKGQGYEFSLNGQAIRAGQFSWNSIVNFTYFDNTVNEVRLENNAAALAGSGSTVAGVRLGTIYVYRWAGLDNKGQSQIYDRNNNIINNTTNLPSTFTKEDLVNAGTVSAPYNAGFINNFKYGSFNLGVQITGYFGHIFLKNSVTNYPNFAGTYSGVLGRQEDLAYRWRQPGDEANTNVPGLGAVNFNSINRYRYSDVLVRKADNIRLQQISLAYTVPQSFLPRNAIKSVNISANIRNLGMIWKANKDGIDPEFINTGNFAGIRPTTSYVFSINATF